MRTTRTYAILEVSPEIYASIRKQLEDADYTHAFHREGANEVIDMNGIALQVSGTTHARAAIEELRNSIRQESEAWQTWFAGWLHHEDNTVQELGLEFTGFGGENQLKQAFEQWYKAKAGK